MYQEIDGVAIGSSWNSALANVFMYQYRDVRLQKYKLEVHPIK